MFQSPVANSRLPLRAKAKSKATSSPARADTAQTSFAVASASASNDEIDEELRQLRALFV